MSDFKNYNELSAIDKVSLLLIILTMTFCSLSYINSVEKRAEINNVFLIENGHYQVLDKLDNMKDCLDKNISNESIGFIGKILFFNNYKYSLSCESIYKTSINIHKLKGNSNNNIEAIAVLKNNHNNLKFYPLYKNDKDDYIYFFGDLFKNDTIHLNQIIKINDKIKNN